MSPLVSQTEESATVSPRRILTTHIKTYFPPWGQRSVILPGWREEAERTWGKPWAQSYIRDLYWGWKLFRAAKSFDAVVTCSERAAHVFALLQRLARRKRVPHIWFDCLWYEKKGMLKRALQCLQYRVEIGAISRIGVHSRKQADRYAKVFSLPVEKFVFLPYHTTLYGADYPVSEGDYIFSGGDSRRDYATLIQAVRGFPYRVVIAVLRRDHFQGLNIPPNVEILAASHDQFFSLMAGARLVVVPMRGGLLHSAGHQTYLNAMAMGKPVVVADDCGADEYITHGVTGLVVQPGDSASLREALRSLMENLNLARWLGSNAKAAAAQHTPEQFYERIFALVNECVGGGGNG